MRPRLSIAAVLMGVAAATLADPGLRDLEGPAALDAHLALIRTVQTRRERAAEMLSQHRATEADAVLSPPIPPQLSPAWQYERLLKHRPHPEAIPNPGARDAVIAAWAPQSANGARLALSLFDRARDRGHRLSPEELRASALAAIVLGDLDGAEKAWTALPENLGPTQAQREALAAARKATSPLASVRWRYAAAGLWVQDPPWAAMAVADVNPRNMRSELERLRLLAEIGDPKLQELARQGVLRTRLLSEREWTPILEGLMTQARYDGHVDRYTRYLHWQRRESADASVRATAELTLARLLRSQKLHAEALAVLAALRPGTQSRARVEWERGHVLLAMGRAAEALTLYRDAEVQRGLAACCQDDHEERARYALYQGLALEYLGRWPEAAAQYLRAWPYGPWGWRESLAAHLVDLYAAAGQLDALHERLAVPHPDEHLFIAGRRQAMSLTGSLRLYDFEGRADWHALLGELTGERTSSEYDLYRYRAEHAHGFEAAYRLCRHPAEAAPLLQAKLKPDASAAAIYAVTLCAGPTAADALASAADREPNHWNAQHIEAAMAAGAWDGGHPRISARMQRLLGTWHIAHGLIDDPDLTFPAVPERSPALPMEAAPHPDWDGVELDTCGCM